MLMKANNIPAAGKPFTLLVNGDARRLALADRSVHCVVTSPPYYALRDYGTAGQIGLEQTPDDYVANLVAVFREVRRVLRDDGVAWLNLGDSYAAGGMGAGSGKQLTNRGTSSGGHMDKPRKAPRGYKPKDLMGIPWRVAFALQADGWYLRSDIIWAKRSPMPESVTDRPTRSHEYVFLLAKSDRYFYDAEAIKEVATCAGAGRASKSRGAFAGKTEGMPGRNAFRAITETRNRRTVWTLSNTPCKEAHFATFPPMLVEPCILAGTSERGCCPACGAQWKRVVDKVRVATRPGANSKVIAQCDCKGWGCPKCDVEQAGENRRPSAEVGNRDPQRHVTQTVTSGWVPGCKCGVAETVPAVVLDPFNGSGTTGMVARHHGRSYVGNELNPAYLDISRRRIAAGYKPPKVKRPKAPKPAPTLFPEVA